MAPCPCTSAGGAASASGTPAARRPSPSRRATGPGSSKAGSPGRKPNRHKNDRPVASPEGTTPRQELGPPRRRVCVTGTTSRPGDNVLVPPTVGASTPGPSLRDARPLLTPCCAFTSGPEACVPSPRSVGGTLLAFTPTTLEQQGPWSLTSDGVVRA